MGTALEATSVCPGALFPLILLFTGVGGVQRVSPGPTHCLVSRYQVSVHTDTADAAHFASHQDVVLPARVIAFLHEMREAQRVQCVAAFRTHSHVQSHCAPASCFQRQARDLFDGSVQGRSFTSRSRFQLNRFHGISAAFFGFFVSRHLSPLIVPCLRWHTCVLHYFLDHVPFVLPLTSDAYKRLPSTADRNTRPSSFNGRPELTNGFRSLDHTLAAALIRMVVSMRVPSSVSIHVTSILTRCWCPAGRVSFGLYIPVVMNSSFPGCTVSPRSPKTFFTCSHTLASFGAGKIVVVSSAKPKVCRHRSVSSASGASLRPPLALPLQRNVGEHLKRIPGVTLFNSSRAQLWNTLYSVHDDAPALTCCCGTWSATFKRVSFGSPLIFRKCCLQASGVMGSILEWSSSQIDTQLTESQHHHFVSFAHPFWRGQI